MTISTRFAEIRRKYFEAGAASALVWARDEEAREALFGGLRHAYWHEVDVPGWRDRVPVPSPRFLTTPDSRVAVILWKASDSDASAAYSRYGSTSTHHGAREFFAGQTDFLSTLERQQFGRNDLSWNMRRDLEEGRAYFRARYSRQEAEVRARAMVMSMVRELESPRDQFGYGFEVHYLDIGGTWRMHGADSLWACDHDDAEEAVWQMGIETVFREACELAGAHGAAHGFAVG